MDRENQMRKIIIGDIHGCLEEVLTLLEEAEFDRNRDMVIQLGDMIDRGPVRASQGQPRGNPDGSSEGPGADGPLEL